MCRSSWLPRLIATTALASAGCAYAAPTVNGLIISWPDDGWYQVQNAQSYESLCEGGRSCEVPAGLYNVINLSTGQRFEGIEVASTGGDNGGGNLGGSDDVYPATINIDTATAPTVNELPWSFNGEPVTGSYVADADGDGLLDFLFMTPNADAAPCETQVVVLSSLADSFALTSEDLPDTLQLSSTLFADKNFDGNGCFNIVSVDNARDINGDGLEDLSVFMDPGYLPPYNETFYQSSAVVFGTRTGAVRDVVSLDGQNGFLLTDTLTPIEGIGDINGDGYGDYSFQNSGFFKFSEVQLRAGTATFPARQVASEILDDASLAVFDGGTSLSSLGDVNADGLGDFYTRKYPFDSRIYLGSSTSDIVALPSNYASVYSVGDHDNDGYDDFLVGEMTNDCGFNGQISAIIYGSADLDSQTLNVPITDFDTSNQTRLLSSSANTCGILGARPLGDINGDGVEDVKVGSYVLFGASGRREAIVSADDLDGTNGFRLTSDYAYAEFMGADVDADGYSDIVTSDPVTKEGSVIYGMPTVPLDPNGAQQIVVQIRQGEWTVHWQSPGADAVAYSLSVNGQELANVSNTSSATINDPSLDAGGILVVTTLDGNGNELGNNTRQVPAYEEYGELTASVFGPKIVELLFSSESRVADSLFNLVWRNGQSIDSTSPNGARSYYDTGAQPGQIYRYYIQPDYLLGDRFDDVHLTRWPLLQRASRVVEAWTPLDGVEIPPAGSGVLITDGDTLYWPDDGTYIVKDADDGSVVCEGGLACTVPNGTYDVTNQTTGESYPGIVVSRSDDGGVSDGIAPSSPSNVTFQIYAARVAELFWDRPPASERVVKTEIYRDGELLGFTRGNSYYDGTRKSNTAHWYELVAIDADGDRSTIVTLNLQRAVQTLLPADPAASQTYQYETALDGNTAVVGSSGYDHGSITIQERNIDSGMWVVTQEFDGDSDASYSNVYGSLIEISGNTLAVVGTNYTNENDGGLVLIIYTRNDAGVWQETQRINDPVNDSDSVSINGDTMAVRRDTGVEIFTRDTASNQWLAGQLIAMESEDFYPDRALALVGDYLAVGRVGHLSEGVDKGAVYLYHRSATGVFSLEHQLVPESSTDITFAGRSIAFDGETVAFSSSEGGVVVFEHDNDGNWAQTADLGAIGPSYVIPKLAVDGGRLLVGTAEGNGLINFSGVVAVYKKQNNGDWIEVTRLVPTDGSVSSFGSSVNLDGNMALVGAGTSAIDNGSDYAKVAIGHYFVLD